MSPATTPALFQPIKVGDIQLAHRVVLSPMTRLRTTEGSVPSDLAVEYYAQRASIPGTLLITEGAIISPQAGIWPSIPGVWSDAQIAAWKKVTDAVHAKGSYIYLQIAAMGRTVRPELLQKEGFPYVAPSPIALRARPEDVPRELTKAEIKQHIGWFVTAAANAVRRAGFDGIEVHGGNGFLVDQFIQDVSNQRTDEYGGSVENRARFVLELMDALVAEVGQTKAAIRLTPWSAYQDMGMEDPVPTFTYLTKQLKQRYPNLAFLHVVTGGEIGGPVLTPKEKSQEDFIPKLWAPRPIVVTGGFDRDAGLQIAEEPGRLVGYGRPFLANPDLPFRLRKNLPLNKPDPNTFYTSTAEGYTTYPFSEEFLETRT